MSIAPAAVDKVGTVPLGHLTVAGHVIVLLPVPSCTILIKKLPTPTVGAVKDKVQGAAVSVIRCFCP
jgi:hypothetical protein